ncbi:MAG: TetR/AcrR family transcriptional regulator [Candidatus Dormibacteria bacterium]
MPGVRRPWGTISREQVVLAAIQMVESGGYERLTIRQLATNLEVGPMSLYRHVRDKDDLLGEVVDHLLERSWRPREGATGWRDWVAEAAERLHQFLVSQPAAMHIYLSHPVVSPAAVTRMNAMMEVLRHGLGDERVARQAYAAVHTYTVGFAALESSRSSWSASGDGAEQLALELAAYTTPSQFREGLGYLLRGIEKADPGRAGSRSIGTPPAVQE